MSNERKKKVAGAIQELKALHDLGQTLNNFLGSVKVIGRDQMDRIKKDYRDHRLNEETVRKIRQFAKEYPIEDRDNLFQRIREEQSNQEVSEPVFGKTHLCRILSIKKDEREVVLGPALKECWGLTTLQNKIKQHFGIRKKGGRKIKPLKTLPDFLNRLDSICESWKRFKESISEIPPESQEKQFSISDLPRSFKVPFEEVSSKVLSLQKAIQDILEKKEKGRISRFVDLDDDKAW